jgi:prepilin-type processing-associated H-X9-DG protein
MNRQSPAAAQPLCRAWSDYAGASSTDENNITFNGAFGSRHPGEANSCFGDGHVVFIPDTIDMPTYQAMSTFAGGENLMYSP